MLEKDVLKMIEDKKEKKLINESNFIRLCIFIGLSLLLSATINHILIVNIDKFEDFFYRLGDLSLPYLFLGPLFIITGITFSKQIQYHEKIKILKQNSKVKRKLSGLSKFKKITLSFMDRVKYSFLYLLKTNLNTGIYTFLVGCSITYISNPHQIKVLIEQKNNWIQLLHTVIIFAILKLVWDCIEIIMNFIKKSVPDSKDRLSIVITIIATIISTIALLK